MYKKRHRNEQLRCRFSLPKRAELILYSGAVVFERIFDISGMIGCSKFAAVAGLCVVIYIVFSPIGIAK